MSRAVTHNRCQHCWREFTRACVATSLCRECAANGHTEDRPCLPCLEGEAREMLQHKED